MRRKPTREGIFKKESLVTSQFVEAKFIFIGFYKKRSIRFGYIFLTLYHFLENYKALIDFFTGIFTALGAIIQFFLYHAGPYGAPGVDEFGITGGDTALTVYLNGREPEAETFLPAVGQFRPTVLLFNICLICEA